LPIANLFEISYFSPEWRNEIPEISESDTLPLLSAKAASMISLSWAASLSESGWIDELAERPG